MQGDITKNWHKIRNRITTDETHHDLRQSFEESVFPYIPKAHQQRSGLLVDFLNIRGQSAAMDIVDLMMFGENRIGVLLAHIPATIRSSLEDVTVLKSALRDQKPGTSAAAMLRALDTFFSENLRTATGVPAFYILFDQQNRTINFASAGHIPVLLYRPNEKQLFRLTTEGNALGLAPHAFRDYSGRPGNSLPSLRSEEIRLQQHDMLIIMSDGALSARNAWGEQFGMKRMVKLIRKYGHMQPTPFLVEAQNAIEQFTLGETLENDVSMVTLKNMLPDLDLPQGTRTPEAQDRFLTLEEEEHLWRVAEKHPEARINELMDLLGERYQTLGYERIRACLAAQQHGSNHKSAETPRKRFESLEKYFHREMLQAFPVRQLLYRKYEFRGNTAAIKTALEHYQNGHFQESLIAFMKVRKAIADSEAVHCFFGNLYILVNMTIKAKQEFLKAIKLNPRSVHAYLALAYISLLHEDYDNVINNLRAAIRLDDRLQEYDAFLKKLVLELDRQHGVNEWLA